MEGAGRERGMYAGGRAVRGTGGRRAGWGGRHVFEFVTRRLSAAVLGMSSYFNGGTREGMVARARLTHHETGWAAASQSEPRNARVHTW